MARFGLRATRSPPLLKRRLQRPRHPQHVQPGVLGRCHRIVVRPPALLVAARAVEIVAAERRNPTLCALSNGQSVLRRHLFQVVNDDRFLGNLARFQL